MKSKITEGIRELEEEKGIKVLLACEIGPKALGIPHLIETNRIGFIYMHPKDWYLSLDDKSDIIDLKIMDESIAFHGWDLRKALMLLYRSNTSVIERIQSNAFMAVPAFKNELDAILSDFYSPISVMYHHLSIAKKNMHELEQSDQITHQKACYLVRSVLICRWILHDNDIPPLSLNDLLNGVKIDPETKAHITRYIGTNMPFSKTDSHPTHTAINSFMNKTLTESENHINQLTGAQNKTHDLNALFVKWLNQKELFFSREVG